MENTWKPVEESWLLENIDNSEWLLDCAEKNLWNLIKITPKKWQQHPWGDEGQGFYAVGVLGNQVIYYNDIEDGYNLSKFKEYGIIDEYWCNQNELHHVVNYLLKQITG